MCHKCNNHKTNLDWLNELPEPYRAAALAEYHSYPQLVSPCDSLDHALATVFCEDDFLEDHWSLMLQAIERIQQLESRIPNPEPLIPPAETIGLNHDAPIIPHAELKSRLKQAASAIIERQQRRGCSSSPKSLTY